MPTTVGFFETSQRINNSTIEKTEQHGGYGIKVITGVCGTLNSGSIPGSRPDFEGLFNNVF